MDASRNSRVFCGYLMRLWNATAIALPVFSIIHRILSSAVRLYQCRYGRDSRDHANLIWYKPFCWSQYTHNFYWLYAHHNILVVVINFQVISDDSFISNDQVTASSVKVNN